MTSLRARFAGLVIVFAVAVLGATEARAAKKAEPKENRSLVETLTARVEAIEIAGSGAVAWGLLVGGVICGYGWWFVANGQPRRFNDGDVPEKAVQSIASAALVALDGGGRHAPLTKPELGDVRLFYEKWLNLDAGERDHMREELRTQGIDMIKLGDAIRRQLDTASR
jgi:hypothetical protein